MCGGSEGVEGWRCLEGVHGEGITPGGSYLVPAKVFSVQYPGVIQRVAVRVPATTHKNVRLALGAKKRGGVSISAFWPRAAVL